MTTNMTNDILKRLQEGENAEDIANELITHLNEANKQFQKMEEEKKRAAAEKAATEAQNAKFNAVDKLIDGFYDVCRAWDFDAEILEALCDIDVEEVVNIVDLIAPIYAHQLKRDISALKGTKDNLTPAKTETEDAIESFLNKFVR